MKKIISIVLSTLILVITPLSAFANNNISEDSTQIYKIGGEIYDENNIPHTIVIKNNSIYLTEKYQYKYGGGLGKCPTSKKTFKASFTRQQAKDILLGEQIGYRSTKLIMDLMLLPFNVASALFSILMDSVGYNAYITSIKDFINSGKSNAHFVFYGKCEEHKMYGDKTYDYRIYDAEVRY